MRYAFHYIDVGQGWDSLDRELFTAMLALRHPHAVVCHGNVVHWDFGSSSELIASNAVAVAVSADGTIGPEKFVELITTKTVYVQLVQGLTDLQARAVDAALASSADYVGVLRLSFEDPLQWAIYGSGLPDAYRIVGRELRIRWRRLDGEEAEVVAEERRDAWRGSGLFDTVQLEDIGLRATIFDAFDTREHAALGNSTLALLNDLLGGVANQVVMRAADLDPHLIEGLHAALQSLGSAQTSEALAQVALSCRRFLQRLADRVFPATAEIRAGRKLGPAEWKNRLWAFAETALGGTSAQGIDDRLADVGAQIDWVARAANAGVHRPEVDEAAITRLVLGLVSLVFDLCLISPPPYELPGDGYEAGALVTLRSIFSRDPE